MKTFCVLIAGCLVVSCVSIDVESSVKDTKSGQAPAYGGTTIIAVPIDTEPVIIQQPMYIPQGTTPPPPASGRATVEQAHKQGILQPQDYEKAVILYDYHRDFVYQIYCQPLRISDIILQPGERIVEPPFISDSERWLVGAGTHFENDAAIQHIYLKPTAAHLSATLIINTNLRTYHLILKSYSDIHMPVIRFRYFEPAMPQNFVTAKGSVSGAFVTYGEDDKAHYTDPRYLSLNYRIRYGLFRKPQWLPTLVYDDGKKTYIAFPASVLQAELPAVFEDRANIVNYRVSENLMIIDKLITKITIKLENKVVVVEKKKGGR
jgi:type IV secretion system protein VirB9